jgi:hypothetical protein
MAKHPLWLAFDQHDIDVMKTVLDAAWNVLRCNAIESALPERAAATRTLLARRIIARACAGEMSYGRLLMHALDGFIGPEPQATDARPVGYGAVHTA